MGNKTNDWEVGQLQRGKTRTMNPTKTLAVINDKTVEKERNNFTTLAVTKEMEQAKQLQDLKVTLAMKFEYLIN